METDINVKELLDRITYLEKENIKLKENIVEQEFKGFKTLEEYANEEKEMIKERTNKGKLDRHKSKYGDSEKTIYRFKKLGNGKVKIEKDSKN